MASESPSLGSNVGLFARLALADAGLEKTKLDRLHYTVRSTLVQSVDQNMKQVYE